MQQGIIIKNIANKYWVEEIKTGNVYECMARGKLKKEDNIPVVGDNIEFESIDEKTAVIQNILKRDTYIKRPKLSNLTKIFLVVSLKSPKPDLLLLDKQLIYAKYCNITPIIILNKVDLILTEEISKLYEKIGYKVIKTNAKEKKGIEKLKQELYQNKNAFSGNSGVGKSTLINAIIGEDKTIEGEISKKNKKGKNTTTAVTLYKIEENTYIADTPGFATFDIFEISSNDLAYYYPEMEKLQGHCKYIGCSHIKEEECAIKEALQQEIISQERYQRYCQIYKELKDKEEHRW